MSISATVHMQAFRSRFGLNNSSGGQVLMAIEQHRAVCPGVTYAIDEGGVDLDPGCKEHSINIFSAAADYWLTALFTAECVAKVHPFSFRISTQSVRFVPADNYSASLCTNHPDVRIGNFFCFAWFQ